MIFERCVVVCFSFFFFKQKTAYEMRISDWSSDVCSSDLGLRILLAGTGLVARGDPASAAVITIVAASDGPSAAAQQGGYVANEIVVTAQKRVESIQDVPIAMTALSSEDLNAQKIGRAHV